MRAIKKIEDQIKDYLAGEIQITPDVSFSQYETIKRIFLFSNNKFPTGNKDSQGNYKYYYDIISSRVDNEVKNIDFDTKDIFLWNENIYDVSRTFIANSYLKDYLKDTQQAVLLNDIVEMFSGMGNIVLKKIKNGYELYNPLNFFVTNQAAETLDDTNVIERHNLNATQLLKKKDIWENVDEVIKTCGNKGFAATEESNDEDTENVYYEIYEFNGQITLADFKEIKDQDVQDSDNDKYVLAKLVLAGLGGSDEGEDKFVLFAEEIKSMADVYVEAHRGRYQGRWFRKGIYEILFDIQIDANTIGNQISKALEFGATQLFFSPDSLIHKNILTDMQRGDIIRTSNLSRIPTEMRDITSFMTKWNLLMQLADRLVNSYEVSQGESMPSGTPFRLGALLNVNANKLFDFLREKLALAIKKVFNDWIMSDLLKKIKTEDVIRLTSDPEYVKRYKEMKVDSWYLLNLLRIGPHPPEMAEILKQGVKAKMDKQKDFSDKTEREMWKNFKPKLNVIITGENVNIQAKFQNLYTLIQLEADPIRRSALIEKLYAFQGEDVSTLPKSTPEQLQPVSTQGGGVPVPTNIQPQTV